MVHGIRELSAHSVINGPAIGLDQYKVGEGGLLFVRLTQVIHREALIVGERSAENLKLSLAGAHGISNHRDGDSAHVRKAKLVCWLPTLEFKY